MFEQKWRRPLRLYSCPKGCELCGRTMTYLTLNLQPKLTSMSRAQVVVILMHVHLENLFHARSALLEGSYVSRYSCASIVVYVRCRLPTLHKQGMVLVLVLTSRACSVQQSTLKPTSALIAHSHTVMIPLRSIIHLQTARTVLPPMRPYCRY